MGTFHPHDKSPHRGKGANRDYLATATAQSRFRGSNPHPVDVFRMRAQRAFSLSCPASAACGEGNRPARRFTNCPDIVSGTVTSCDERLFLRLSTSTILPTTSRIMKQDVVRSGGSQAKADSTGPG